jgi:hypothetical protein
MMSNVLIMFTTTGRVALEVTDCQMLSDTVSVTGDALFAVRARQVDMFSSTG